MLESVEIKKALHYNHYNILNNQLDIKASRGGHMAEIIFNH